MEEIKFSKIKNYNTDYDAEADVLYLSFGEPKLSETIDTGKNLLIRLDIETGEINGFTILNFSEYGREIEEVMKLKQTG